ncbi:MAG: carbohydrate-binding family 9-like protein, partial [Bacteroidota bacterium]
WEIPGLKAAVQCYGTLNDPSDTDEKWTVELAFPWKVLEEAAKHGGPPKVGEQWRVNFSRVHWRIEAADGIYRKVIDPRTGKHYPEYNWVWSPQGAIAMHQPETWGYVEFRDRVGADPVAMPASALAEWQLWQLYYAQHKLHKKYQLFTGDLGALGKYNSGIQCYATSHTFEAFLKVESATIFIREDGKITILHTK